MVMFDLKVPWCGCQVCLLSHLGCNGCNAHAAHPPSHPNFCSARLGRRNECGKPLRLHSDMIQAVATIDVERQIVRQWLEVFFFFFFGP